MDKRTGVLKRIKKTTPEHGLMSVLEKNMNDFNEILNRLDK